MEPVIVTRRVELDLTAAELWERLSDPDALASWLGDDVRLDLTPGGAGIVVDGDVTREVRITDVSTGSRLAFTWWDRDDPSTPSHVVFRIDTTPGDTNSRLVITETLPGSAGSVAQSQIEWEVRVLSLWACTVVAALVQ